MHYVVRHLTRFVYTSSISESVMELRMQPLDLDRQRCLRFSVTTMPRARVFAYHDHYGNAVHYFDIPGQHTRLDITVESTVDTGTAPDLPESLSPDTWAEVDAMASSGEHADWLLPSPFTTPTPALEEFAAAIGVRRGHDPLSTLRDLNRTLFTELAYEPLITRVDSLMDDALRTRSGVCQDFSHIMTALVRGLGIPCRYVSGYIAPGASADDRADDHATHAWVEALFPGVGWVGFDPTNNTVAGRRQIAVAIGRDYGDVPPTRGVFKGDAGSELSVAVAVAPVASPIVTRDLTPVVSWIAPPRPAPTSHDEAHRQQQ